MSASKREREAARRRYATDQASSGRQARYRRRQRMVALVVVGALVLTLGVGATVALGAEAREPARQVPQLFLEPEELSIPSVSTGGITVSGRSTSGPDVVPAIADEDDGDDAVAPESVVIIEGVQVP